MSLSETALLTAAGDRVYRRGEDYVRYVRGLRIAAEKAYGYCTWPHHSDGNFCKHLVAVGLATIYSGKVDDMAADTAASGVAATTVSESTATAAVAACWLIPSNSSPYTAFMS
jgi:hypothetical protein